MKRRQFLSRISALAAAALVPSSNLYSAPVGYNGRILFTLEAFGGWDVTAFCDPKTNVSGEKKISNWSDSNETQVAGNISYAPFAENEFFFNKYHNQMLVINGIDSQTNAHETATIHTWSGRTAEGYPSLGALFSAKNNASSPLAYISTTRYNTTSGLVRFNRIFNPEDLAILGVPDIWYPGKSFGNQPFRNQSSLERIKRYRKLRTEKMLDDAKVMGKNRYTLEAYSDAISGQEELRRVAQYIPENGNSWNQKAYIDTAVVGIRAGLVAAVDIQVNGSWDSHDRNDSSQTEALTNMTETVDYLWEQAELYGFADRLTVILGSEFGRTPYYNSQEGKDHWPIGSMIVMEKNATWTNRSVGLTDGGHNALKINANSLARDDSNGMIIYPKHVHKALRKHLGIDSFADSKSYGITTEEFNFFT